MAYRIVGDVTMLVHFGFLVFVAVGGFLAWRWPRLIWAHLAVSAWASVIVLFGPPCPLTGIESWARTHAGETPLHGTGFIDNYLEGVVYPARYTGLLQALVAVAVVASWVGYVVRSSVARGRRGGSEPAGEARPGPDHAGEVAERHT